MESLKKQLQNLDLKQVRVSNGETLSTIMEKEAKRLYRLIQERIDKYYSSYHSNPYFYERTGNFRNSLFVDDIVNIKINGNGLEIGLGFQQDLAMHRNIFDNHDSFVPLLMERGWKATRLEEKYGVIEHFTRFDGINAVRDAIEEFNRSNKYGIVVNADNFYNATIY